MNKYVRFVVRNLIAGFLIFVPVYLATLLVLKAAQSVMNLVEPVSRLLPGWMPGGKGFSLLLVLLLCFLAGIVVRTPMGHAAWRQIDKSVFQRIPAYSLFQGFTQRLAGESQDETWRPALAEIEEALVPAFIVEEFEDGRLTVFVPSVPTPLAGAVYILAPDRVHPLNVPFTLAIKAVSQWGSGSKELVAHMEHERGRRVDRAEVL